MNEDYLWDKTGEPDSEIQQLEQILGTLRYQPKPLELPRDVLVPRRRRYFPVLAIAATLLAALLAGGLWLRVRTASKSQPKQAKHQVAPAVEEKSTATIPEKSLTTNNNPPVREKIEKIEKVVSVSHRRPTKKGMGKREREEALAAKQQLMLALRVASEKLHLAHRKTQSTPSKNQHRVG
jgi:hypothetical protein